MESAADYSNTGSGDDVSEGYGSEMDAEHSAGEGEGEEEAMEMVPVDGDDDLDPYVGMEFETADDAWTFYNTYACRVGFNTRISVSLRSRRDGSITARQFVCAREGFRARRGKKGAGGDRDKKDAGSDRGKKDAGSDSGKKDVDGDGNGEGDGDGGRNKRTRAVTRVGCKAMIRIKRQESGRWIVSKLHKVHNHELVAPSRAHCLRSHRLLSATGRSPSYSFIGAKEESREINTIYPGITPQSTICGGLQTIIEYLHRMQADDSRFFYAMQFDGGRCTGNVFWADARSRMAYKHFGDVVTFDTFYKISQCQIPFASFTGINHHGQPVLFGCALLVDDSESSLVWLFRTMLLAMSGCHPISIVLERDWIVQAAALKVFPRTRHRLCKWHILKEGQEKLSHVYNADPSFRGELYRCINTAETIDEFESSWEMLIARFNLRDNEWLQSVYNCRHQWVPVYLRTTFFAEMSSIQRCETSSFFEGYVNALTDPQTFIQQYEKALDSWYEKEVKADCDTMYTSPVLKTPSPIEKQAAEQYTRKIFAIFQEELIGTSIYTSNKINEEGGTCTYRVAQLEEEHKAYTVIFNAFETKATCSCLMFEYSGILCRHILTVFRAACVFTIPAHYISKRWTKNARNEGVSEINSGVLLDEAKSLSNSQDPRQSLTWRYNSLCHEAIKFAEDGAQSIGIYNVAMHALHEAVKRVSTAKKSVSSVSTPKGDHNSAVTASQPSQGWNMARLGQPNNETGNGPIPASSEPQLLAVPMVFYVPTMINTTASGAAGSAGHRSSQQALPTAGSKSSKKRPSKLPVGPTNSIRATAIAAGARIVPPSAAASVMKAVQSRIAIHIRAAGSARADSSLVTVPNPAGRKPMAPRRSIVPSKSNGPGIARQVSGEDQTADERGGDFTDSGGD